MNIAQHRARTAIPNWKAERIAHVNQLAKTLDTARPGTATDALHALKQTSHGCKLLAARYQKLIDDLTDHSGATDHASANHEGQTELPTVINNPFTTKHLETLARLENFNGTMPDPNDTQSRKNLWRHLLALMTVTRSASEASSHPNIVAHIAHHAFGETPESLALTLPDPDTARRKLIQYLSKRKHSLTQRARHLWQTQDRPARDEAPSRALFDPTPEGKLLARYMNDAQRTMRLALKELQKAKKEREKHAAGTQFRDPISEISNQESQFPPIEPNTPQPQPDSRVKPVRRADSFEAHQCTDDAVPPGSAVSAAPPIDISAP